MGKTAGAALRISRYPWQEKKVDDIINPSNLQQPSKAVAMQLSGMSGRVNRCALSYSPSVISVPSLFSAWLRVAGGDEANACDQAWWEYSTSCTR